MLEYEGKFMKVYSFAADTSIEFDKATTPEYAVAYAYHVEQSNTADRFFQSVQDNDGWWQENTPYIRGKWSLGAGDWAVSVTKPTLAEITARRA
jgi:hypothetical protein